jgi:hypothetical protein
VRSTDSPFPREDDTDKALSIARLEEGLEVLEGGGCKGLGMTGDQARRVIISFPRLLTYKIDDNLAKKVDFLLQRGYMINDVKREVESRNHNAPIPSTPNPKLNILEPQNPN